MDDDKKLKDSHINGVNICSFKEADKIVDIKPFVHSGRVKIEDQIVENNNADGNHIIFTENNLKFKLFIRVGGKKIIFKEIDFSHSYFENCYFRDCVFENCKLDGCKFTNSNFHGCSFPNSTFEYANFEKTFIDNDVLINNIPKYENITSKFARSLRLNYSSLGDAESAHKAMKLELKATETHLYKSWQSKEKYYRTKYQGLNRIAHFFKWFNFRIQNFVWGNGESPKKLFFTGFYLWVIMTIIDVFYFKDNNLISNYFYSFLQMPSVFLGINKPSHYSEIYLSVIAISRLIGFSLFMSIIIKLFNKR